MKKPGEYIELFRSMKKEWKWLLKYISKYRLQIVFYVIIGLLSTALGLGASIASKYLIDSVISHNTDTIVKSAVIAVLFAVTQILVGAAVSRLAAVVGKADFRVAPGETVAFVGPSGEGKTTLLRLILGLVEPDSGVLTIRTNDGTEIPVCESTRRFCSFVPQGNAIFSGTVADNLRIACPDATDEQIIEALQIADAWSFVSKLPFGINTEISEKGVNFSEGQVQRMSIARAILRDAPIVVMDEATSALDAKTEEKVLTNMMKTYPNRARIITTHRPSMLKYCTRVYKIVDDGILIEAKE